MDGNMDSQLTSKSVFLKFTLSALLLILLFAAVVNVSDNLSGTKNWPGEISIKRGIAFIGFALGCLVFSIVSIIAIWKWGKTAGYLARFRNRLQKIRWLYWLIVVLIFIIPPFLINLTPAGIVLSGFFVQILIIIGMALSAGFLLTNSGKNVLSTSKLGLSLLLISTTFILSLSFSNVVGHPFSLTWSEGNRIWDYSVLFGAERYNNPAGDPILAFIDLGRQSLWGLPFLIPGITITQARLWNAVIITVPYAVLGWVAFKRQKGNWKLWILSGLWTLVFLYQGPIYTPLVLSAILVALAWWLPIWAALPLIAIAGYYAEQTRFTWMFAPAMWTIMLFFGGESILGRKNAINRFGKATLAVLSGVVGGLLISRVLPPPQTMSTINSSGNPVDAEVVSFEGLRLLITDQPLLWDRLLPNPTYPIGILLGLMIVSAALISLLVYFRRSGIWKLDWLQKIAVWAPVAAFLLVGVVISVKIGGGGDLHNLDMYLIAMVFASALAWKVGASMVMKNIDSQPVWVQAAFLVMLGLFTLKPITDSGYLNLPPKGQVKESLATIQSAVASASQDGEVLFMDQRQLLTFGFVENIPLVDEYEKKYLMNQAMSGDAAYFEQFYEDIRNQRFSLIITEPLKIIYYGNDHHFGLENDTWVKWVSEPVLCYYEPLETFKNLRVELLIPRSEIGDCP